MDRAINIKAALLVVFSTVLISSNDVILKVSTENLGIGQLLFIRGIAATLIFSTIIKMSGRKLFDHGIIDHLNLARSACESLATFCFVLSLSVLSIAVASTLIWTAPILLIVCSAIYLKERVSFSRWVAVLIGFIGCLLYTSDAADD